MARYHHIVYVVELYKKVLSERKFSAANPNHNPDLPCLYIGQTGKTDKERFEDHLLGHRCAMYVKRYGVKLIPKLYRHIPPVSWEDSLRKEKELTKKLRNLGYAVWSG